MKRSNLRGIIHPPEIKDARGASLMSLSNLSDEVLIELILSYDRDFKSHNKLVEYCKEEGKIACIRRMLALFQQRLSSDLCNKAWEVTLSICLTDKEPEMDEESSKLWTEAFLTALEDREPGIRIVAAKALCFGMRGSNFDERIIKALLNGLANESESVRFSFAHTLQHIGSRVIPYLLQALADDRFHKPYSEGTDRRSNVWDILCILDGILDQNKASAIKDRFVMESDDCEKCAEAVADFLSERFPNDGMDYLDIWKAGDTLGEGIGGREGFEKLSALVAHPDPRVRASVAHGLSHIKELEAQKKLTLMLDDPAEIVRAEVAKYLKLNL